MNKWFNYWDNHNISCKRDVFFSTHEVSWTNNYTVREDLKEQFKIWEDFVASRGEECRMQTAKTGWKSFIVQVIFTGNQIIHRGLILSKTNGPGD